MQLSAQTSFLLPEGRSFRTAHGSCKSSWSRPAACNCQRLRAPGWRHEEFYTPRSGTGMGPRTDTTYIAALAFAGGAVAALTRPVAAKKRVAKGRTSVVHAVAAEVDGVERVPSRHWRSWSALDSAILKAFLPATANFLMQPLVGTVDLFWVGRSGDAYALAGMGAANQVYNFMNFAVGFLPTVVTPKIAHIWRKGSKATVATVIQDALALAAILGAFCSIALVGFPHRVLSLISTSPDILAAGVPYLRFRGLSYVFALGSLVSFACFRGTLDFSTPLKVAFVANLVNVALDPLFMNNAGLGVAGVALATSVAELLSCLVFVAILWRRGLVQGLPKVPTWKRMRGFVQSGTMVQARSLTLQLMFLYAVRRVTMMDPTGIQAAAYQVVMQFWMLGGTILFALSSAAGTLVPNQLSELGVSAARQCADRLVLWGLVVGSVLGCLQVASLPLLSGIVSSKAIRNATVVPSFIAAWQQVLCGVVFAGEGVLQGLGAFRWLTTFALMGATAMLCITKLSGRNALTGVWFGLWAFNLIRLLGYLLHRLKFGQLAQGKLTKT
eukprot:TRINITY_DN123031_c0_g1_i1.p1 TRINITY_DN123031_c0_g1~~TRINITY_DN123031_c0_g1_i1.p1  ORF type:complete len:555 (-),score=48.07 TRINITY_DN123031_c0_g1_i1:111-1775(-)